MPGCIGHVAGNKNFWQKLGFCCRYIAACRLGRSVGGQYIRPLGNGRADHVIRHAHVVNVKWAPATSCVRSWVEGEIPMEVMSSRYVFSIPFWA